MDGGQYVFVLMLRGMIFSLGPEHIGFGLNIVWDGAGTICIVG